MTRQARAYLYAGGTVLAWGTVASAFKLSLTALSPAALVAWASLVSFLFLAGAAALDPGRAAFTGWRRRDWAFSALMGLLNPALYYLILFAAYDRLAAQQAQPLNFTWPIVLALLSAPILGQRIRPAALGAMLLSLAGVVLIAGQGDPTAGDRPSDLWGVVLALGSTLPWALYWLLGARDRHHPVARLAANFLFGTLFAWVWLLAVEGFAPITAPALAGAVWVGLFEMGLSFVLWLKALKLADKAARVGNLVYLTPFLSLVLIHLVLGEPIGPGTVPGLALIVAGIVLFQRLERPPPAAGPKA